MNPFKNRKGLGRGLSSLIGDNEIKTEKNKISISSILPNKFQPRKNFDKDRLSELTNSIKERGIIQPLIVRKSKEQNKLSSNGNCSWVEVECLGACANSPVVQVGKDYFEDLSVESFRTLIDELIDGTVPKPGSRLNRFSSEPENNRTALIGTAENTNNGSVSRAIELQDSLKRIVE